MGIVFNTFQNQILDGFIIIFINGKICVLELALGYTKKFKGSDTDNFHGKYWSEPKTEV
jgi:hypothetical protein